MPDNLGTGTRDPDGLASAPALELREQAARQPGHWEMGYFPRWLVTWLKYWPTSQNVLVYRSWGGERVAYMVFLGLLPR